MEDFVNQLARGYGINPRTEPEDEYMDDKDDSEPVKLAKANCEFCKGTGKVVGNPTPDERGLPSYPEEICECMFE